MIASVYGYGINDRKYISNINNKPVKEYSVWIHMLQRCYSKKWLEKRPTYSGCYASDNFKKYSYFYEWCNEQVGFLSHGFQIDKDILLKGNKFYCEQLCVFVPVEINSAIITCKSKRGIHPVGVYFDNNIGLFVSKCSKDGKQVKIGNFDNHIDAFNAYKCFKENHFKQLAEKYSGLVDPRVCEELYKRKVEIND